MMGKYDLPYFPCYTADWLNDTQDLTDTEDGSYFRLVRFQWKYGFVPSDLKKMRRISDCIDETWPVIKRFFVKDSDGNWINKRTERERQKIIKKMEAGKAGGSKTPSKDPSKSGSKTPSKDPSKTPSKKGDNSEPRTQSLDTQNSELKKQHSALTPDGSNNTGEDPSPQPELAVLSFLPEYPSLNFPSMTIPRLLQVTVMDEFGEKALRYVLEQIAGVQDIKKRYAPAYVKKIIENAPLLKITTGEADEQGHEKRAYTKEEALAWCDRNGARMDQSFSIRKKSASGETERFDDGKAKFFLINPEQLIRAFAEGARA